MTRPSLMTWIPVCAVLGFASTGWAQELSGGPPPAHKGFQLALRSGYTAPFGEADKSMSMGKAFAGQAPIMIDIGGKITPNFFLGGYGGTCVGGGPAGLTYTWHFGMELAIHFLPDRWVNPWFGLGGGFEVLHTPNSDATIFGAEVIPLMGGVDFRLAPGFGLGPYVALSAGQYSLVNGDDVRDKAWHGWATVGMRIVVLP